MRKSILAVAFLFVTISMSAQFYISGSTGYAFATEEKVLGKETTLSANGLVNNELKGSYGKGLQNQLRIGYFLSKKVGIELAAGYLHGTNQNVRKIYGIPNAAEASIIARGRAFGGSLSLVYNITENVYARAGYLTKLGGRTEAIGNVKYAPLGLNLDFTTDFHGKLPSGVIAAVGYKFPIAEKFSVFFEAEYMNINVKRDKSKLREFSATLAGNSLTRDQFLGALSTQPTAVQTQFAELKPLLADETTWGQGAFPSSEAPYSSFGLNIGITYTFGK